jgi:hypothetical protein
MTQEERLYDAIYVIRGRTLQWAVQIESLIDIYKAIPNYYTDLQKIIEFRNVVAHLPVPFSEEAFEDFDKKGMVTFAKLKTSKKHGLASAIHVSEDWINRTLKTIQTTKES